MFPFGSRYCARHFNEKYYVDIDDDFTEQDETIPMNIWGWSIYPAQACDYEYVGDTLDYTIGSIGHEQTLQVTHANDDTVQVKVKTVAIERANTIAIYDPSTKDFTGHYNEKKRTTVIQLYLNTDTSFVGTHFVEGPNAIVIPTSLFTNTELHGYLEHDRLDETPLYSEEEGKYEFYSVDRDGNELEDACGDCDFHFVRFDISAEDAMEILYLLVSCLVNESTGETAVLYDYISTKDDGITASMMNLPSAAMAFIPLYSPYVSAENGEAPRPFDPLAWFLGILIICINATFLGAVLLIFYFTMAAIIITTQNNENAHNIGMQILTWLAHLIWLLVRAAILIFAYIEFAFLLLVFIPTFLFLCAAVIIIGAIFDKLDYSIGFNVISFQKEELYFTFGYEITSDYIEFFDIEIPTLSLYYETQRYCSYLPFNMFQTPNTIPSEDYGYYLSDLIQSSNIESSGLKTSGQTTSQSDLDVMKGFSTFFNWQSFIIAILGVQSLIKANDFVEYAIFIATILVFISGSLTLAISLNNSGNPIQVWFGMLVGFIAAFGLMTLIMLPFLIRKPTNQSITSLFEALLLLGLIWTLIEDIGDIIITYTNIDFSIESIVSKANLDNLLAIGCIVTGSILLGYDEKRDHKFIIYVGVTFMFLLHLIPFLLVVSS